MANIVSTKRKLVVAGLCKAPSGISKLMLHRFSNICTVTIFVGSEKTRFEVHQDQLCEASKFFKAAFTSQYKESSEKTIDLPEDDIDTFDLFVQWLYEHQCDLWTARLDDTNSNYLMQPIRLLVFADKYDIPHLKKYILEKLLEHTRDRESVSPSVDAVVYAYSNTCRGSGVRRLLADWYATRNGSTWFQAPSTVVWLHENPEIAVDLVVAFAKSKDQVLTPSPFRQFQKRKPEHYMEALADVSSTD